IFKIAEAKRTASGERIVLGDCSTIFGDQSRSQRAAPVQHAGNSSSIVAIRHDLRQQRISIPATLDERRTRLDHGCGRVRCGGFGDWGDRLSGYCDYLKKQATGKEGRGGNQCGCASNRDALRREPGLSAGLFLCEGTGAIRELREDFATQRALLSRSK